MNFETIEITEQKSETIYKRCVILFNDDVNDFDHVEDCLVKICFKSRKEAEKIAKEAHNKGRSVCYVASLEECETVAEKLSDQGLTVSVQ